MTTRRRRIRVAVACAITLGMIGVVSSAPTGAAAQLEPTIDGWSATHLAATEVIEQIDGTGDLDFSDISDMDAAQILGPNPWTSIVPGRDPVEIDAWNRIAAALGQSDRARQALVAPLVVDDNEAVGQQGMNDSAGDGQLIEGFGTGRGEEQTAVVRGVLDGEIPVTPPPPTDPGDCASIEDDGAIQLSSPTGAATDTGVACSGTIGDGPFGETSGDFDFWSLGPLAAGQPVNIALTAPGEANDLQAVLIFATDNAQIVDVRVASVAGETLTLEAFAPANANYNVAIVDIDTGISNPFDSSSGSGAAGTGDYVLGVSVGTVPPPTEVDFYLVDLEAGDTIRAGFNVQARGEAAIIDPNGVLMQAGAQSIGFAYPEDSPLRHFAQIGVDHVAKDSGRYAIAVAGVGNYEGELFVSRPGLQTTGGTDQQILFIDFDGAILNPSIFGGPDADIPMSPLSSFLAAWGLGPDDEDAVIDAVMASVVENLSGDLRVIGGNGDRDASGIGGEFDVEILNSRDDADVWGQPNVSRVIVGGTIQELGIGTVGIAESIDPGNFDTTETGIVLLDLLSLPAELESGFLNDLPLAEGAGMIDLIGVAVGNIVAHEAGHFLGNWHSARFSDVDAIMDEGGNLAGTIGLGPDGVFGSPDDSDTDFADDVYSFDEGFVGVSQSPIRTGFAFSTGRMNLLPDPPPYPDTINLPEGFAGEGIAVAANGRDFFAGSLSDGRVAKGDLRTGEVSVFVSEPAVVPSVGLTTHQRSKTLFVAGGPSGQAAAYNLVNGNTRAVFTFAEPGTSFINDVVVAGDAAYFTDSFNGVLHVVPIKRGGGLGEPYTLELTGPAGETPGQFNNNGIVARSTGKQLVVVNSTTGQLSLIDPETGASEAIDLGGVTLQSGDGLEIDGQTLYVLKNGAFPGTVNEVVVINLNRTFTKGQAVRTIQSPLFETATTLAKFGSRLAAVNAQFAGAPIDDGFEVVIFSANGGTRL